MPPSLRPDSKFNPFSLTLANGALLSGISFIPPTDHKASSLVSESSNTSNPAKPLLILIHGGKCTPYHFDLSSSQTYSSLSVPAIAIHRPGYGESTSFLPFEESNDGSESGEEFYHLETARWLHDFILPALWNEFGAKNGCSGVVVIGHSMGGIQTVVTAALHARKSAANRRPKYPLSGIVISGMGCRFVPRPELREGFPEGEPLPDEISYKPGAMEMLMLNDRSLGLCEEDIYPKVDQMDVAMPRAELLSLIAWWPVHWKEYAASITAPVLYGLGEHDWIWETSEGHVMEMKDAFESSVKVEGSMVLGAPHCLEWSRVGGRWIEKVGVWAEKVGVWADEVVSKGNMGSS